MAERQQKGLRRCGVKSAPDGFEPAGRFVFERLAFAAILAPEVKDQADEEEDERPEDQERDIDPCGQIGMHLISPFISEIP
jgi:hypothetical protein